jgi:beta-mannanase
MTTKEHSRKVHRRVLVVALAMVIVVIVALVIGVGSSSGGHAGGSLTLGTGTTGNRTGTTTSTTAASDTTVATAPSPTAGAGVGPTAGGARVAPNATGVHSTGTVATHSSPTTVRPPALPSRALFGVATDSVAQLVAFNNDAGKRASLDAISYNWSQNANFDTDLANAIVAQGAQVLISWEPWDQTTGNVVQPAYTLGAIISGTYDAYIAHWASQIKAWGQPVWVRFAHEMNGNWYPWDEGVNGNTPGQYVAAWRHVHDIFARAGAANVIWVWSPNVVSGLGSSLASVWPGDAYVDWIGLDGYNWGTLGKWGSTWQSFSQIFGPSLAQVESLSGRPIVIAETASTEVGGDKAAWIQQFFASLAAQPRIGAFVWFNQVKETDWRIESSPAAQAAFRAGVANPRYPG